MATNPQADGQTKIGFQISDEEKAALQKLADQSGMKLSAYIRMVLTQALREARIYRHQAIPLIFAQSQEQMVAEDQAHYGASKRLLVGRVTTDKARRVIEINADFTGICGYAFDEVKGRNLKEILQRQPGTEPDVVARLHAALEADQPITETLTNFHKNGTAYRCRLQIQPTLTGFTGDIHLGS